MAERRRGAELERAILQATWLEMAERGFNGLTMEAVAMRAGTSRPVLARRWNNKLPLAIAAIRQQLKKYPLAVPDRGNVRAELLEFLELASQRATGTAIAYSLISSEYFAHSATTPSELRRALIEQEAPALPVILERAIQRSEIDAARLTAAIRQLLNDLFRHYVIMNFAAPPQVLRQAWVDEIFLPLVRPQPD